MTMPIVKSMRARLKTELLYDRYNSENLTVSELEVSNLEILYQLLEQSERLHHQWWSSHAQATEIL